MTSTQPFFSTISQLVTQRAQLIITSTGLAGALLLGGCSSTPSTTAPSITTVPFAQLAGWNAEQAMAIKPVMLTSCEKLKANNFLKDDVWGSYQQWSELCKELAQTPDRQMRSFFEVNFLPMQIDPTSTGLFTGYYSPLIEGSLTPSAEYSVPLLKKPKDLVVAQLSDFGLEQKTLVGDVENGRFTPYDDRQAIEQSNPDKDDVLLWLKDPVDKFFLQVQGSGNIELPKGEIKHVGYAGNNGHNYVPIGSVLKQAGELTDVSMQSIRQWLKDNPSKREWLFNKNPRYIFFTFTDQGAITATGAPAVAMRTLAVDPATVPLNLPVWVDTTLTATDAPFQQLMMAQDTGSAIKGTVRGDIYMGMGKEAAKLAGEQQSAGKLYVLTPR